MDAYPGEADAIERIRAPGAEVFRSRYFETKRPVVISGAAADWPALARWTRSHLASVEAPAPVPVDVYESGNFFEIGGALGHRKRIHMPFRRYIETRATGRARYYAPDLDLRRYFPELERDVRVPTFLPDGAGPRLFLFAGESAITAGHFHPFTHALTCQVLGRKRVVIYPPEAGPELYPFPWFSPTFFWSRVDFSKPDYGRFPKLRSARPLVADLEPGDAVFIPAHFWHWTEGFDFSVSVLVSWKAEVRDWHFPAPGLACAFAKVVSPFERMIRKAASGTKRAAEQLLGRS